MKIIRERPSQRLHHRVTAPLYVAWRGDTVRAVDWSLGGLRLSGVSVTDLAVGQRLELAVSLPFQGFDVGFSLAAELVRIEAGTADEGGEMAVRFLSIDDRARNLMRHFVEELVRGSMVDVEDTIQRIDVPVTPVSTKPDPNPAAAMPVRRWPVRTLAMTGVYLTLGLGLVLYTTLVIYANFFKLEVQTAVVTAPLDVVVAHGDGRIALTEVRPGDPVTAGQHLGTLVDHELEQRLDMARIAVERAEARTVRARRALAAEQARTADQAVIAANNRARAEAEIAALVRRLELAESHLARLQRLNDQGWSTAAQLDLVADEVAALEVELALRRIDRAEMDQTRLNTTTRDFFDRARLDQAVDDRQADLALATDELAAARAELAALERHRTRLAVQAPFDGRLIEFLRPSGASVTRGDALALVEDSSERVVEAFMNQDEVLRVGLGDRAGVYLPALDRHITAVVERVDRTTGFVDEQRAQYTWRGPQDRSARVILRLAGLPAEGGGLDAGLPAVVVFDRRSDDGVLAGLAAWAGRLIAGSDARAGGA